MKTQTTVALTGLTKSGTTATTQDGKRVVAFVDVNNRFKVVNSETQGIVTLCTDKGKYPLEIHDSIANLYTGVANDVKVHFTKKKIVGKLIYWS